MVEDCEDEVDWSLLAAWPLLERTREGLLVRWSRSGLSL